jgi:hypothetical protein
MRAFVPILLALLTFLSPSLKGAVSQRFERLFTGDELSSGLLRIELFSGRITVLSAEDQALHVTVTAEVDTDNQEEAQRLLKELSLTMESRPDAAVLLASYGRDVQWSFDNSPPVKLSVVVVAPPRFDLSLRTEDGSIDVARMGGRMKARTRAGQVYFRGVDGYVDAETVSGDIVVAHCSGDVRLRSIHGSLRVGPVGGFADVAGHGGSIELDAAGKGVKADSSGGDLSVVFRSPVNGPAQLRTSGGNLYIAFDRRAACLLDLRSSIFGKVSLTREGILPIEITGGGFGHRRITGKLNGGGPMVDANAAGGSIFLQPELSD